MLVGGKLRFLVDGQNRAADQFPDTIRVTDGSAVSVWDTPDPTQNFGQGTGRDYNLSSGVNPFTAANKNLSIVIEWE